MKKTLCIAFLALIMGMVARVFGLAGTLDQPGVAFPTNIPEADRKEMMDSLKHPDCKYIGGNFINSFTSLRYGGDTKALNLFLSGLLKTPGTSVSVLFSKEVAVEGCDWMLSHSANQPRHFAVRVNLKSSHINLEELVIPEAKGPASEELRDEKKK